jgi:glycosyltransferase involved in cell wall biosynthesis
LRLMREYPNVTWLGQRSRVDTLRYIRAANLLISASRSEGAPTVVREARALGTPVVAAIAGDLSNWAQTDDGLVIVRQFEHARALGAVEPVRAIVNALGCVRAERDSTSTRN